MRLSVSRNTLSSCADKAFVPTGFMYRFSRILRYNRFLAGPPNSKQSTNMKSNWKILKCYRTRMFIKLQTFFRCFCNFFTTDLIVKVLPVPGMPLTYIDRICSSVSLAFRECCSKFSICWNSASLPMMTSGPSVFAWLTFLFGIVQ